MYGMFVCGLHGGVALVDLFLPGAGDAVIFYSGETAIFRRGQMRSDIVEIQIKADVAVKIAVTGVAGIAFALAPDLARGIEIAPEGSDAIGRKDWSERAEARARICVQDAMGVEDEPADVCFLQKLF